VTRALSKMHNPSVQGYRPSCASTCSSSNPIPTVNSTDNAQDSVIGTLTLGAAHDHTSSANLRLRWNYVILM
jgi:hypothetical protein